MSTTAVKRLLERLKAAYPAGFYDKEKWSAMVAYWCEEFARFPDDVLEGSFAPVRAAHPDRFPSMTQLEDVLRRLSKSKGKPLRQMDLPPHPKDHTVAVRDFYGQCDRVLAMSLGEQITKENRYAVEGIIAVMGPLFGFTAESMRGDEKSSDPEARFNYCQAHTSALARAKLSPHQVAHGLRKVPGSFATYPTHGELEMLIRGGLPENPIGKETP